MIKDELVALSKYCKVLGSSIGTELHLEFCASTLVGSHWRGTLERT